MVRNLHLNLIRFLLQNVSAPEEIELRSEHRLEHAQILDACRVRDAEIGEILLRRHLTMTSNLLLRISSEE